MDPDAWAIDAASLPVAFSQVREDPRLDLEVVRSLPEGASVMMIASGGETAVCLSRLPLRRLVLVDMNPAQLALTKCRFHLAEGHSLEQKFELLGHREMPSEDRAKEWSTIFEKLQLAEDVLGDLDYIARVGPDYCGRYEAAFAEIQRRLQPYAEEIESFLSCQEPTNPPRSIGSTFAEVLRLDNLITLFGEGATQNPRRPFSDHFTRQLCNICSRFPPADNPWIWQMLFGRFPESQPYDWFSISGPIRAEPEYLRSTMLAALQQSEEASIDFLHLSNILDWLSPSEASEILAEAHRCLTSEGRLMIRQLNSSLEIPALAPYLRWDLKAGRSFQLADRSFFYPEILIGLRS
ncbi:MAG: DUF3419 family protein [Verrucomicrobiota bacterium]